VSPFASCFLQLDQQHRTLTKLQHLYNISDIEAQDDNMADNNLDEVIRNMSRWQQHQDQEEEKAKRYMRIEEHYARIHALLKKKLEKGFVQPVSIFPF
jgi:hypothetical protein